MKQKSALEQRQHIACLQGQLMLWQRSIALQVCRDACLLHNPNADIRLEGDENTLRTEITGIAYGARDEVSKTIWARLKGHPEFDMNIHSVMVYTTRQELESMRNCL